MLYLFLGTIHLKILTLSVFTRLRASLSPGYLEEPSFAYGRLDVTIPDPVTRLRERYDDLKDLITDLRVDINYLQGLCDDYERILKEHGLL